MQNRRNLTPPVYNPCRLLEIPCPNYEVGENVELDDVAERNIQVQIDDVLAAGAAINEFSFVHTDGPFSIPMISQETGLIKREGDLLSGNVPYPIRWAIYSLITRFAMNI